ncbi:MAG: guanylate kinase [Micrococcales bacterium]|nr:guanylate kinase [Micrococcales bacterium]
MPLDQSPRPVRLVVLAGPTAVGKGAVAAWIRKHRPDVWLSVSATTRPPRPGEVDGRHYHFLSDEEFSRRVADGEFLEWARVHGRNRYGTLRAPVERVHAAGTPALLEIDLQGARQVRQTMPEALFVFLAPPSWQELVRRLVGRGTEDEAEREARLSTARVEISSASEFDVVIVNEDVQQASEELVSLMGAASTMAPQTPDSGSSQAIRSECSQPQAMQDETAPVQSPSA